MSLENLNEETHPELYAQARQTLDNCDWYEDGKFRDGIPSEDLVIATMIHFRNAEVEALAEEVRRLRAEMEWRPLETAPRTGEHIQVVNLDGYGFGLCGGKRQHASDIVHWFVDGFYSSIFGTDQETPMTFTHWRPLPDKDAVLAEMEANNENSKWMEGKMNDRVKGGKE